MQEPFFRKASLILSLDTHHLFALIPTRQTISSGLLVFAWVCMPIEVLNCNVVIVWNLIFTIGATASSFAFKHKPVFFFFSASSEVECKLLSFGIQCLFYLLVADDVSMCLSLFFVWTLYFGGIGVSVSIQSFLWSTGILMWWKISLEISLDIMKPNELMPFSFVTSLSILISGWFLQMQTW